MLGTLDSRGEIDVNKGSQGADERSLRRARSTLLGWIGLVILGSNLLVDAFAASPLDAIRLVAVLAGVGEIGVLSGGDGSDFDWAIVLTGTKATSNDTTADPRAEDVGKVDFDRSVSPFLELLAGVDEVLYTGSINVSTERDWSIQCKA